MQEYLQARILESLQRAGAMIPLGLTQKDLAEAIHVPYQRINELINGKRGVTPSTALRLARYFDMASGFWLNLQLRWDLYYAARKEATSWIAFVRGRLAEPERVEELARHDQIQVLRVAPFHIVQQGDPAHQDVVDRPLVQQGEQAPHRLQQ